MQKTIFEMKKREFKKIPLMGKKEINEKKPCGVVIVPTGKYCDTGYGLVNLVFFGRDGIPFGKWNETADLFHLKDFDSHLWTFDILHSGYLRVFCDVSVPILLGGETYFSISPRVKEEEMKDANAET